jgi:toxin-antitoxin system PIN domain toxin
LDVNLLVALAWPNHLHHALARRWFADHHRHGWATTPVSESGFVRVSSNRAAIATATTPELAMQLLTSMLAQEGHEFWADDIAIVTGGRGEASLINSHRDVSDAHLLALAERHGGRLVTFDAGISRLLGNRDPGLLEVQEAEPPR